MSKAMVATWVIGLLAGAQIAAAAGDTRLVDAVKKADSAAVRTLSAEARRRQRARG